MTPIDLTDTQESMMQAKDDADLMWAVENLCHAGSVLRTNELMRMIEKAMANGANRVEDRHAVIAAVFEWIGFEPDVLAQAARYRLAYPEG